MNSKQIITTVIIIAALAGAGVFGYLSLTGNSPIEPVSTGISPADQILPNGTKLDFSVVNEYNETGRQFQYPVVTPVETGLTLNEIIEQ